MVFSKSNQSTSTLSNIFAYESQKSNTPNCLLHVKINVNKNK